MEKLPYNPPEEDFQKANLSEKYLYDLYHDSHPTYTPLQYAKKVIVADRLVRNTPIPVEEKPWERKGFCDTEGCCWVWRTDGISEFWEYINPNSKIFDINESDCAGKYTHCLPHDFIQQPNIETSEPIIIAKIAYVEQTLPVEHFLELWDSDSVPTQKDYDQWLKDDMLASLGANCFEPDDIRLIEDN